VPQLFSECSATARIRRPLSCLHVSSEHHHEIVVHIAFPSKKSELNVPELEPQSQVDVMGSNEAQSKKRFRIDDDDSIHFKQIRAVFNT